jgi:hypothetical protein
MAMTEGKGTSQIGGAVEEIKLFNEIGEVEDKLIVINKNVPHEIFPVEKDMVVFSLHTCCSEDLIEITCENAKARSILKYHGTICILLIRFVKGDLSCQLFGFLILKLKMVKRNRS